MNLSKLLEPIFNGRTKTDGTVERLIADAIARGLSIAVVRRESTELNELSQNAKAHVVVISDVYPSTGPAAFSFDALASLRFAETRWNVQIITGEEPPIAAAFGSWRGLYQINVIVRTDEAHRDAWRDVHLMLRRSKHLSIWPGLAHCALTGPAQRHAREMAEGDIRAEANRRAKYAGARRRDAARLAANPRGDGHDR